jgi:hypothetical protein
MSATSKNLISPTRRKLFKEQPQELQNSYLTKTKKAASRVAFATR